MIKARNQSKKLRETAYFMPDRFLPDYGLYLLSRGVRPETWLVFFELPVEHLTRPDLRTVCLTLST